MKEYDAKLIGKDPLSDIALLKIDAKDLPAITLADSGQVEVGDVVLVIGNPFNLGQTVTMGIVSALGRNIPENQASVGDLNDFIQTDAAINQGKTDAAINQGNSGGALVDSPGPADRRQQHAGEPERRERRHRLRDPEQHGPLRRRQPPQAGPRGPGVPGRQAGRAQPGAGPEIRRRRRAGRRHLQRRARHRRRRRGGQGGRRHHPVQRPEDRRLPTPSGSPSPTWRRGRRCRWSSSATGRRRPSSWSSGR